MKFLKRLRSFFFLIIPSLVIGQDIIIVDSVSKFPLEGVALFNSAKTAASITNKQGSADLSVFSKDEIVFVQFYGFKSRSFKMANVKANKNFLFVLIKFQ